MKLGYIARQNCPVHRPLLETERLWISLKAVDIQVKKERDKAYRVRLIHYVKPICISIDEE